MSREDGSGTRGAFVELTGVEQDDVDMTTVDAVITNSTAVMLTSVAGDPAAIGYVSMGSLNETVKAVSVDGNAATVEGVKDGSYTLARPFVVTTFGEVGEIAQDLLNYIMSAEGQAIINEEGYIAINDAAEAYTAAGVSGEITVGGSSSVTPVMEKLAELPDPEPQNTDFLECVRTRRRFALDEEIGHRSCTLVNMGACALRLNRTLHFDPVSQLFVGDDAANRLVDQPMRRPWQI